jgi:hypothetical protein
MLLTLSVSYRIHRIFLDFFRPPVFQKNTTFRKLDLFLSSSVGLKTPTQLGPLERANLNDWANPVRFRQLFNHLRPG